MKNNREQYYEYVYELMTSHTYPGSIPLDSLNDVLEYFEEKEDYEKCNVLRIIIESRN
tara:strand:+ start:504 stop:677 length:174 start_codon:yes stop_codon:yes gene_type:complete